MRLADARVAIPSRTQLVRELAAVVGDAYVYADAGDVLAYEYDASNITSAPDIVVLPASAAEVCAILRLASRHRCPVVPRGAGTGIAGGALPIIGGIVVGLNRMNRILEIDLDSRLAVVEPGVTNIDITRAVGEFGYFYAPDPSSQYASSIGGNVAHNSGGPHTIAYGVTSHHVLGLELALPDGTLVRLGTGGADAPGLDLTGLVVGGEGTLGIVTRVWVRLMRRREDVVTLLAAFDDVGRAGEAVTDIIARGVGPVALELMDRNAIRIIEPFVHAGYPLDAEAVLLIEVEGLRATLPGIAAIVGELCRAHGASQVRAAHTDHERQALWLGRKAAFGTVGRIAINYYLHDAVVPRSRLPEVLRRVQAICERERLTMVNISHAGDGNLHPLLAFDARVPGETDRVIRAGEEMLRACVEVGGTISGEHGVGFEKNNYMPWIYTDADLAAMRRLKQVFDPDGLMNPWKVFPTPVSFTQLLRPRRFPSLPNA
jgi:glycolate oxidase